MATGASSRRATTFATWAARPAVQITLGAVCLLGLTLLVLGPVLFAPGDLVFSNGEADLAKQFVHWRAFGFGELRAGRLALWNPHIFSGTPFFGGFQSALLYPPNWLYLCLPLVAAINVGIALHVFLAGFFMQLWARQRGLRPLACLLAGVLFMFSGPYFLHIYAGHLSNLCTMVWGPLIFLAIDGWLKRRTPGWLWVGAGAVALQILAGHPQYVFYTGVAASLYCAYHLTIVPRRVQAVAGLAVLVTGAVGLSAVQLFEGFHVAGEEVRNHGTSPEFAAIFSFPPVNLLTAVAPGFFGDMNHFTYWGRFDLWEMSLFFSLTGFVLAIYGAWYGERPKQRFCAGLALVLLVVAFGANTPLFTPLYQYAPGFGKFRGWSKFVYPAMLFLVMLAAAGFDAMLCRFRLPTRGTILAVLIGSVALGTFGAYASITGRSGTGPWQGWVHSLYATGDVYQTQTVVESPGFAAQAASFAAGQMFLASGTLFAIGMLLLLARRRPAVLGALLIVATVEMVVFASSTLTTFHLSDALNPPPDLPTGDYRLLNLESPNLGMSTGRRDLWGYDPGVLRRYAEWIAVTQGIDADAATESLHFWNFPRGFASLARCRFVFPPTGDDGNYEALPLSMGAPGERLSLVCEARVIDDRDDLLQALQSPEFDPRRCVLLPFAADPPPVAGAPPGSVRLVSETSDSLTVAADLPRAAILLITDTYCTGWRARSLLPKSLSVQARYNIIPADYFLRAIPLQAGHHRFVMEYLPASFVVGKWLTLTTLALYFAAGAWIVLHRPG